MINYDEYASYFDSKAFDTSEVKPGRGTIYDRNNKALAINTTNYILTVIPNKIQNKKQLASDIAKFTAISKKSALKKFKQHPTYVLISNSISSTAADSLKKIYRKNQCLVVTKKTIRKYPYGDMAGQTLGYTNSDNKGIDGLELNLEKQLKGVSGFRTLFRNGEGYLATRPNLSSKEPINGDNIQLTLNIDYQNILHEEIVNALEKYKADKAMGILIDPNIGEILALASAPAFDPNSYSKHPAENRKNILVTDSFEPGSTFKVFTAAAALEEGVITPEDTIETHQGYIVIQGRRISDHHRLPDISFADVIKHSSNVGTIRVAQKLGTNNLFNYVRKFGFKSKTNVCIPGEVRGIMPDIDQWTPLRSAQISMGQGISCTAMQITYAYAAIANGGYIIKPQIIKTIKGPKGIIKFNSQPTILRQVASKKTMQTIRKLLLETVASGTGSNAKVRGMYIAGKTGTAQKAMPGIGYNHENYVASFIGFFPADNPKLLCTIVIDNPRRGSIYGGSISAPVAKNVFKRVVNMSEELFFENDNMGESLNQIANNTLASQKPGLSIHKNRAIQNKNTKVKVPNLIGLCSLKAIEQCEIYGINLELEGSGKVVTQYPRKGTSIKRGETCRVTLSTQG